MAAKDPNEFARSVLDQIYSEARPRSLTRAGQRPQEGGRWLARRGKRWTRTRYKTLGEEAVSYRKKSRQDPLEKASSLARLAGVSFQAVGNLNHAITCRK